MPSKPNSKSPKRDEKQEEPQVKPVHEAKSKTGRSIWLGSHIAILCLGIYLVGVTLLLRKRWMLNRIIYRLDFLIIAANYISSVYHYLEGESVRPAVLLAMDSVQYAGIAILWVFMPTHVTKTLPFTLISLLHVLDAFAPEKAVEYSRPLSLGIGYANIMIFFKLGLDFLRIRHGAAVSILVYAFFYRVRIQFSSLDRECANSLFNAVDHRLSAKSTPEKLRGYWIRTKKRIQNYESVSVAESRKKEEEAIKKANAAA